MRGLRKVLAPSRNLNPGLRFTNPILEDSSQFPTSKNIRSCVPISARDIHKEFHHWLSAQGKTKSTITHTGIRGLPFS
jgi:hypothetical protein